jgi:cyclopropane-fatty-acyl-phospholipid synthase
VYLENKLHRWVIQFRQHTPLPLKLELWNGRQLEFGMPAPQVTIRLPHISAVPYLLKPTLANMGHAYVESKIDIDGRVDDVIRIGSALAAATLPPAVGWWRVLRPNRHTRSVDAAAVRYHYDVSNAFYQAWLDPEMVYSCAYFEQGDETLAQAQLKKIDHILTKIRLREGQTLLDIGCGWGALVRRAATHFGARCVGITLSQRQYEWACEQVAREGLADRVEIRLEDYRDVCGTFDRITSVGMFEHVGLKNLSAYFRRIHELLADDGMAMNHGITSSDSEDGESPHGAGDFIGRYVFPEGELPHIGNILRAMQDGGLEALDVENLRRHYARTCAIWADNFEVNAAHIRTLVGEKRYRIWRLYLAGSAYGFEQGWIAIHQVLCAKAGRFAATLPWSRRFMYPALSHSFRT